MQDIAVLYPEMIDIRCFSHTTDHVGEHFKTPHLHEFGMYWVNLFSHSPKTQLLWREQTSRAMPSYSPNRWWSRWEIFYQVMALFGDVEPFLYGNESIAPATKASFFTDNDKKSKMHLRLFIIVSKKAKKFYFCCWCNAFIAKELELAIVIDYGENFVKATYDLEGDGPLILHCFEIIDIL